MTVYLPSSYQRCKTWQGKPQTRRSVSLWAAHASKVAFPATTILSCCEQAKALVQIDGRVVCFDWIVVEGSGWFQCEESRAADAGDDLCASDTDLLTDGFGRPVPRGSKRAFNPKRKEPRRLLSDVSIWVEQSIQRINGGGSRRRGRFPRRPDGPGTWPA